MPRPLILIIEDGDQQREFIKTALQRMDDIRLETAPFPANTIQSIESVKPDLVIFDLATQDAIQCLDLGEGLRKLGIPVIFINGPRRSMPLFQAGDTPAMYFPKPVSAATISTAVEMTLQNRCLQKQVRERSATYHASLEMLPGALGLFDRRDLHLLEASQSFTNLFQLNDGHSTQVLLPDLLETLNGTIEQALENAVKYGTWLGRCLIKGIEREGVSCQVRIRPVANEDPRLPLDGVLHAGPGGQDCPRRKDHRGDRTPPPGG